MITKFVPSSLTKPNWLKSESLPDILSWIAPRASFNKFRLGHSKLYNLGANTA